MRKGFAILLLELAISFAGLAAQQAMPAAKTTAAKIPPGAHQLTAEEFKKLLVLTPVSTKARSGQVIKNPRASELNSAVITGLAKQKQSADAEMVSIRALRSRPGLPAIQRGTTMSSAQSGNAAVASRGSVQLAGSPPTGLTPPAGSSNQSRTSKYATLGNTQVQSGCALSNGQIGIGKVTGEFHALTFTPISQYNLYIIHGCNFGDANPGTKAWLYGPGFHADFQIEEWTDSSIVLKLGENISGVLDQDSLHLVVHRADGKEAQADGFKFYAARRDQPVLLQYIPPAWRKLDWQVMGKWAHPTLQSNSPVSGPYVPKDAVGVTSIFVSRFLMDKFPPSSDSFDFGQLPRGWVVDSVEWVNWDADCPDVVTYRENFGQWNVQWGASTVQINWGDTSCSGFFPNPFLGFPTSAYQNKTESKYALKVMVNGPRGTESLLPHM